jgi:adenylate cyclase
MQQTASHTSIPMAKPHFTGMSPVRRYEFKSILLIAICWTIVDFLFFLQRRAAGLSSPKYSSPEINLTQEILLRELNVFLVSLIIGYFLVSFLRHYLRNASLWFNIFVKTVLLVVAAFVMNFFIYVTYEWLIAGRSLQSGIDKFQHNMFQTPWLLQKMPEWIVLFILTLLAIEVNEKYSRGVFINIMLGRYLHPREENRIIMFLDLRDSTPIAEKLGSKEYFQFIGDFIFYISEGILSHEGRIYQYVGDEIVIWWPASRANARKSIAALITSRKVLNKQGERFRRKYGMLPEYKAGIHVGTVTVGQVGIIKKDLVMSGDAINTAARIRSACTELNHKFLVSKDLMDLLDLEDWQTDNLGPIDLKGKNQTIELFALKI